MNKIKRNLLCLLAMVLLFTGVNCTGLINTTEMFSIKVQAASKVIKSGNCGNKGSNLTFKLYNDGTLVIKGNGKMKNYRENKYDCPETPWGSYVRQREQDDDFDYDYEYVDNKIKSVIISEGVTSIGDLAFKNCRKLTSVSIPKSVSRIYDDAFDECYALRKIYYAGTKAQWSNIRIGEDSREIFYHATKNFGSVGSHTHDFKSKIAQKASLSQKGKMVSVCSICNKTKTETIAKIASVKLSATTYKYNGKVKTPSVVVKDANGNKLVMGDDFSVTYSNGRKKVGKYSVKVTFKGKYTGTKNLTFKIVKK